MTYLRDKIQVLSSSSNDSRLCKQFAASQ